MKVLRLLCFGGRNFGDRVAIDAAGVNILQALDAVSPGGQIVVCHGDANGADKLCGEWFRKRGYPVFTCPAPWDFYGRHAAGPLRNQWMVDYFMPTYAVGFPGGSGTRDMAERLRLVNCPIYWPALPTAIQSAT